VPRATTACRARYFRSPVRALNSSVLLAISPLCSASPRAVDQDSAGTAPRCNWLVGDSGRARECYRYRAVCRPGENARPMLMLVVGFGLTPPCRDVDEEGEASGDEPLSSRQCLLCMYTERSETKEQPSLRCVKSPQVQSGPCSPVREGRLSICRRSGCQHDSFLEWLLLPPPLAKLARGRTHGGGEEGRSQCMVVLQHAGKRTSSTHKPIVISARGQQCHAVFKVATDHYA
jgi:hypothetical protein